MDSGNRPDAAADQPGAATPLLPEEPYRGLNYYDTDSGTDLIFAGRQKDVQDCGSLLTKARVLVLHGRTGCGKSSFLRAGLAPNVPQMRVQPRPGGGGGMVSTLVTHRTGERPLQTLARAFADYVEDRQAGEALTKESTIAETLLALPPEAGAVAGATLKERFVAFVSQDSMNAEHLLRAMEKMRSQRRGWEPIFVLDQAEEMWTLAQRGSRKADRRQEAALAPSADESASGPAAMPGATQSNAGTISAEEALNQRRLFFSFLIRFCRRTTRVKVLVSMRTEYKGQFDDEMKQISLHAEPEEQVAFATNVLGYYLDELQEDQIAEAIRAPTKETDSGLSPFAEYKFKFESRNGAGGRASSGVEKDLAARIAADLVNGVPRGGVLPVMQVTCLRLWETTRRRARANQDRSDKPWEITHSDYSQIGQIDRQIELFVQERLEHILAEVTDDINKTLSEAEKWYRVLNSLLVNIESDGRVTTKKAAPAEIRKLGRQQGIDAFTKEGRDLDQLPFNKETPAGRVMNYLRENNILRWEGLGPEDPGLWSLGHDSVGLTLKRWSEVYSYQFDNMSKMDMMSRMSPDGFEQQHLFDLETQAGGRANQYSDVNAFRKYHLETIKDNVWDHLILHYANSKGFASRLGLILDSSRLNTVGGKGISDKASISLKDALKEMNRSIPNEDTAKYLISWPRSEFPRTERSRDWTDVVITNAYQGYGLLCPPELFRDSDGKDGRTHPKFVPVEVLRRQRLQGATRSNSKDQSTIENDRESMNTFRESMEFVVQFIVDEKNNGRPPRIWLFDESARTFLHLILELAGINAERRKDVLEAAALIQQSDSKSGADAKTGRDESIDPIFARILEGNDKSAHFMIGTAYGRALATRSGYRSLVDVQDLDQLIDWKLKEAGTTRAMNAAATTEKRRYEKLRQKTQTHTTWQLNLPHDQMDDEQVEPLLYRIAALGFFTAEYIRTNADDFVRFIDNELRQTSPDGTFKLDREFIRSAVRSCYAFFSFEQYASQFLERSSPVAYWQESGNEYSKLRDVYSRMLEFRAEFYEEFRRFNAQYIRLTTRPVIEEDRMGIAEDTQNATKEDLLHLPRVSRNGREAPLLDQANSLKEKAWNNFKIMNFYDAARQMRKAREALRAIQEEDHPLLPTNRSG